MPYNAKSTILSDLMHKGDRQRLPKGHSIQFVDEQMFVSLLRTGYIKRYIITQDGSESIQVIYGPGDIFPLTPMYKLLFNKNLSYGDEVIHYKTMTAVDVRHIGPTLLQKELASNPSLYRDLFYVAGMRLRSNIQRLDNVSLRVAHRRVAHQLLYFADAFGETTPAGIRLLVPLTQDDMASVLNLARETVSLSLGRLREKGLIETDRFITIFDIAKLKQEIN